MQITLPRKKLDAFCRRHHIKKLAIFGSTLRENFGSDSDIDVLVEFEPDHIPGYIRLAGIEAELSELLQRKVDLNTPNMLSKYFRDDVLAQAEIQYEQR